MAPDDLEREKHVFHAHYHVTEAPLSHRKSETAEKKSNRCRNAGVVRSQNEPYPNDWAHSPKYMVYNLIYETKPVLSDLANTIRNGCSCLFVFFVCSCQNVIDTRNVWAYRALTSRTRENPNCFRFSFFFSFFLRLSASGMTGYSVWKSYKEKEESLFTLELVFQTIFIKQAA